MRTVAARIARPLLAQRTLQSQTASFAAAAARPALVSAPKALQQVRFASSGSLSKDDISNRVLEVLKSFEKVDPAKVTASSSFTNDLGLDSLDAVEVVMAVEEEFSIEIPDEEADAITTVGQAIDYISKSPEAH